jgi:shikimate kinase
MAVGKSTVGALVARELGVDFIDLDQQIEAQAGCGIPEIFAQETEAGFRKREQDALRQAALGDGVLALGGGTLHWPGNLELLKDWKLMVLMAPIEELKPRLGNRPLSAQAEALYSARLPLWKQVGELVWMESSPEATAARVLQRL